MPTMLYLGLIILSLIWGLSFFFIKVLLAYYNPFGIVFFRSLFGVIIILALMIIMRKPILPKKTSWVIILIVGLFNSILPWSLISFSEQSISSSMASILNATTPIWTLIVGIILFKAKISWQQWLGILIGFIGIYVLLDIKLNQLAVNNIYGFIAMISATLFYGLSGQISKRYMNNLSSYQITLFSLVLSSVISGIVMLLTDSFHWDYLITKPVVLYSALGLGSLGSGIAYLIYYYLIQKGSAEFASLVTYLVPVTAIFWGVMLLGEEIHLNMVFGLLLILLGVYISGYKKKQVQQKIIVKEEFN